MSNMEAADRLGYCFDSPSDPNVPGCSQLAIMLRSEPTHLHFDPTAVQLDVATADGNVDTLTVHHPWRWSTREYHVCAGLVDISDRKHKTVSAYTFGGELQIHSQEDCTQCVITSSAPILHLLERTDRPTLLAMGAEALLAEQRAQCLPELETFEKCCIDADPLVLYYACLETLKAEIEQFPVEAQREHILELERLLDLEIDRLTQTLPPEKRPANLAQLL